MVSLLNCLDYQEIISFMRTKEFKKANLKDCLKLKLYTLEYGAEPVLLKATADCVLENVTNIANKSQFKSKVRIELLFFVICYVITKFSM